MNADIPVDEYGDPEGRTVSDPLVTARLRRKQRLTLVSVMVTAMTLLLMPYHGVSLPQVFIISLGVLGGGVLFVIGLRRTDIVVILLTGYIPFSKMLVGDFGGIGMGLNAFNLLFLIIFLGMTVNRSDRNYSLFTTVDLLLILYFLFAGISLFRGGMFLGEGFAQIVLVNFKRWISPILLYFLIIRVAEDRLLRDDVILVVMFTVFLVGILCLKEFYIDMGGSASTWEKSRIRGIAGQSNQMGAFFVYYLPLTVAFLYMNLYRIRYWMITALPLVVSVRALMLTISRGAFLSFGIALSGMMFFKKRFLTIILILTGVIFAMFPERLPEIVTGRFENFTKEQPIVDEGGFERNIETSSRRRIYAWRGGLRIIAEYPFFGAGHHVFPYIVDRYSMAPHGCDTHNMYLTIATEMGLPALILFVAIFVVFFMKTRYVFKYSSDPFIKTAALGFMTGIVGLSIANLFGSRMNSLEISGWLWMLGAVFVRENIEIRKSQETFADRDPDDEACETQGLQRV